jgi:hypothetical protein
MEPCNSGDWCCPGFSGRTMIRVSIDLFRCLCGRSRRRYRTCIGQLGDVKGSFIEYVDRKEMGYTGRSVCRGVVGFMEGWRVV